MEAQTQDTIVVVWVWAENFPSGSEHPALCYSEVRAKSTVRESSDRFIPSGCVSVVFSAASIYTEWVTKALHSKTLM